MLGRVVKGVAGSFVVDMNGELYTCNARKSVQFKNGNMLIGDYVEFEVTAGNEGVIEKVMPRKNKLMRPTVANIDKVIIMISSEPQPDFYLIDKMLVNCALMGIEVYIAVNKADLPNVKELYEKTVYEYGNQVKKVLLISTKSQLNIDELEKEMKGGLSCLVGQSAVGKSSLVNVLNPMVKFETGGLSAKISRGKNTTRHVEIVKLKENTYIIDTPGFSFLELDIDPKDLQLYYYDFNIYSNDCRFTRCQHLKEPNCMVKEQVESGVISSERYRRYIVLYEELLKKWNKKYR